MAQVEKLSQGQYRITGRLDSHTVVAALTQFHSLTLEKNVVVDLSRLEYANSAGLALLLELLSDANKQGRNLSFSGIPSSLMDLAEMSNIETLLMPES